MTQPVFQDSVFANLCKGIDHLYSDGQFCDLVVTIGNDNFSCHRLVLAAVSGFFQSSLASSWHESSTGFVNIDHEDVTGESFHLLLDILYKGKNIITMETVKGVLKASVFLRIKFLQEYCDQYLSDNMDAEIYLGAWQFAEKYQLMSLADKAAKLAATHFDEVAKCDELLSLPKPMLLTMLSLQKKLTMDNVCRTILRWAEADVEARKLHLGELLPFVNFTQLTSQCLFELMKYMDHPFKTIMLDYINEGLMYNLIGVQGDDARIQRQIKALQDISVNVPSIQSCAVAVGGYTEQGKPLHDFTAMGIGPFTSVRTYRLKPLPESFGLDFATCVWRNQLYVSGGSMKSSSFSVYKPGVDEWESLPTLTEGREKHCMIAINWKIYVLGGLNQDANVKTKSSTDILAYNTKTQEWSKSFTLLKAVYGATAAALGHRIYVFGGKVTDAEISNLVQSVNTMTGCVSIAGHLPSPTTGAKALSNRGTIFVIRLEGDILQMKENFVLADQQEKQLSKQKKHTLNVSHPTIQFKSIGTFPSRHGFGAFLQEEKVVVCGGEAENGELLQDMSSISLTDGSLKLKLKQFPTGIAIFNLEVLNIPQEFLTDDKITGVQLSAGEIVNLNQYGLNSLGCQNQPPGPLTIYESDSSRECSLVQNTILSGIPREINQGLQSDMCRMYAHIVKKTIMFRRTYRLPAGITSYPQAGYTLN